MKSTEDTIMDATKNAEAVSGAMESMGAVINDVAENLGKAI